MSSPNVIPELHASMCSFLFYISTWKSSTPQTYVQHGILQFSHPQCYSSLHFFHLGEWHHNSSFCLGQASKEHLPLLFFSPTHTQSLAKSYHPYFPNQSSHYLHCYLPVQAITNISYLDGCSKLLTGSPWFLFDLSTYQYLGSVFLRQPHLYWFLPSPYFSHTNSLSVP